MESAYGDSVLNRLRPYLATRGVVSPASGSPGQRDRLAETEIVFSGWGAPRMDAAFLSAMPNLKVVFYAGGSVRYFVTPEFWSSGVLITTAQAINAIPVSEFTVSAIFFALKRVWHFGRLTREQRTFPVQRPMAGAYRSVVGLVSYGKIARLVRERLLGHDVKVFVCDPHVSEAEALREGVKRVELDEMFATADVVSLHTPLLHETKGLIAARHFASMKPGATFINTARGEIVDEPAMIECLQQRPDLQAVLDVTAPEPPAPDSPLYRLPNVLLTPHIAGSIGAECLRMGHAMADEFERYRAGLPLQWAITSAEADLIA